MASMKTMRYKSPQVRDSPYCLSVYCVLASTQGSDCLCLLRAGTQSTTTQHVCWVLFQPKISSHSFKTVAQASLESPAIHAHAAVLTLGFHVGLQCASRRLLLSPNTTSSSLLSMPLSNPCLGYQSLCECCTKFQAFSFFGDRVSCTRAGCELP